MRALLYGIQPPRVPQPDTDNPLVAALARTPMDLVDMPDPDFLLPDWVITKPLLTGVCGSDSKQVFMDFGEMNMDNPMRDFSSMPQVLGHEVVADVVALGPEAEGVEIGDRVVLNPWLSCVPRGVSPICPACEAGELSLCWNFTAPPIAPGIHIGTSKDASGGYATLMPAHPTQLFPVPDNLSDELAVFADPFAVSLHAITRHSPPPGGRVLVYGAGALGTSRGRDPPRALPRRRSRRRRPLRESGRTGAQVGGERGVPHSPVKEMIEAGRRVVGRCAPRRPRPPDGLPGRHRRGVRHHLEEGEPRSVGVAAEGARHAGEGRRARPHVVGVDSAVLQGDQLGRLERVRARRGRRRAPARHPPLSRPREHGAGRPLRHAHAHVRTRRLARRVHRARHAGGLRSDQDRVRPAARHEQDRGASARHGHARRDPSGGRDHPGRPALRSRLGVRARAPLRAGEGRRRRTGHGRPRDRGAPRAAGRRGSRRSR